MDRKSQKKCTTTFSIVADCLHSAAGVRHDVVRMSGLAVISSGHIYAIVHAEKVKENDKDYRDTENAPQKEILEEMQGCDTRV